MKSRRLALLVAIALGGGGFLSSAQSVSAADVVIDDAHAPSDNVVVPGGSPTAVGTAAGIVQSRMDGSEVKGNTLTFSNYDYTKILYGGVTFGTGKAAGNKVVVNPTNSKTGHIYGGSTDGGGNAENNEVVFNGTLARGDLIGGMTSNSTATSPDQLTQGRAKGNKVELKSGTVQNSIYGGFTANASSGDASANEVLIRSGEVMEHVYGGAAESGGSATGNTVTMAGNGTVYQHIYGGWAANGDATGNTVNLGDGTSNHVGTIRGTIYGGRNTRGTKDQTKDNTLNVNANAKAGNIENFSTINFDFSHVDTSRTLLKLENAYNNKTKLQSLDQLHVKNAKVGDGTLIENTNGVEVDHPAAVGRTADKTETIIRKHTNGDKIIYRTYQFKDAMITDTDGGLATWGGRSLLGNTTTNNVVELTGDHHTHSVYGGWTTKDPAITTTGSAEGHGIDNKITFNGAVGDKVKEMFGGLTAATGGNATGNRAVLNSGKVIGTLTGGSVGVHGGSATGNFVDINGGEVGGATYGGYTSSAGKAEKNEVTLTNGTANNVYGGFSENGSAEGNKVKISGGTAQMVYGGKAAAHGNATKNIVEVTGGAVNQIIYGGEAGGSGKAEGNTVTLTSGTAGGDIYGGLASSGDAAKNTVNINGGDVNNHNVYGAWTTSGNATGNTVTIKGNGGTVKEIIGGRSNSGNATGNTVNLGDGTADFTTGITGTISGGSGATVGKDYLTGNTLNVHGNASAANIKNFEKINFYFNNHVNKSDAMLKLSDTGGTTIKSLGDLSVHGERGSKGTLIKHTGTGTITLSEGPDRVAKTEGDTKELVLAKSSDSKKITYESYIFKGATTPTTDDGGTYKDIFGGRSILGNTTTQNTITVSDAVTYRNAYGGWTSGTGTTLTEKGNSISNKITVGSTVTDVTGTVYGGFTDVPGGNATSNEVTIEKSITGGVVGGKAAGDASGNTVTVKANTGAVTGGDGATTNNNTVNLEGGVTVNGAVKGGTQANGTGNTLNVKGENSAQSVEGFQKMKFHADTAASGQAMLNLTTGATTLDKNAIDADGSTTNGRVTLLRNDNGINLTGYTNGVLKSTIEGNTEKNIDVEKNAAGDKIVKVTYEGAQFADVQNAVEKDLGSGKKNAYGGISKAGNATHTNNITVNGSYAEVYGGHTSGTSDTDVEKKNSHDNTVTITGGTLGKVYGGYTDVDGGTTNDNTVNLGDGTNPLAPNTTIAEIHGGNKTATGNTLNVNTAATVGKIENFSKVTFKDKDAKLTLKATDAAFDLSAVKADFAATATATTLVESDHAMTLAHNKTFRSDLSADGTKETNIEARESNTKIVRYGYTLKNATTATTDGSDTWGGRSAAGHNVENNAFTLNADTHTNVYGGWTTTGVASNNTVTLGNITVMGNVTGGAGTTTNDNIVNLNGTTVTGKLTGGTAANGTGNTLNVKGENSAQSVEGFQKMKFHADTAASGQAMLNLTTGATTLDKNAIDADGSTTNGRVTLLRNDNGINLTGYTNGVLKSTIEGNTEKNIDVEKNAAGDKIVKVTYEGAQFADVQNAVEKDLGSGKKNAYGGISKAGNATHTNNITVNGSYAEVYGGHTSGTSDTDVEKKNSHDNTVTITGGTLGKVYGGYTDVDGGTTNDNTVNLGDGTNPLAPNTTIAEIHGGNKTATGNTLNVNTAATVGKIENFSKVTFKDKDAKLTLKATDAAFDLSAVKADFAATATATTLVESDHAMTLAHNKTFRSDLSADGTKETNIEARESNTKIVRYGYTLKNATTATTDGSDTWGGRSAAGHNVENNAFTLNADTHTNVYGGWTTTGVASNNTVTLGNITVMGNVTGGAGTTTNDNIVNLNGTTVTGKLTGGTAANGTGNTLNVKGENSAQSVEGFQKMKFHADTAASGQAMLNLTTGATTLDKNAIDADGSTTNGRVTLLRNDNGINLTGYTNGVLKSTIEGNTEKNIDVEKNAAGDKIVKVTYEGAQFADVQNAVEKDLGSGKKNAYGGISRANNATRNNKITVNGTYENVYGGYTSGTSSTAEGEKKNSHDNTVTITGGTVTGKVYGGYTEATDGKTYNNTVNLNGGNLSNAEISGGNKTATGNTLNVNTAATVKKIDNFQTVTFKDKDANLTLTGTGVKFNLAAVNAGFDAAAQKQTLVESSNALDLTGDTFRSDLSADGTKETNIEVSADKKQITRYGYTFKNAATATTVGSDTWGGRSKAGNTTTGNVLTLKAGAHTNVYGGWTSGTGSKAAADQRGDSTKNSVTVKGTATVSGTVYGGYTEVTGGKATGNTVTVEKNLDAELVGGKAAAEASSNTVNVTNATVKSITGGSGTVTNDNRINLRDAKVTGMVTGGTAANGTGNTLNVSYGTKTTEIGDYKGIRNLHFDMEKAPMDGTAHTMLRLTNVGGAKSLSHTHIDLHRDGAAPKLQQGDKITLMENAGGDINVGENLTAKGTDGVTRNYEFALATVGKTLIATVTKTGLGERAKSFVETRAGASAFLNDGGDYLAGSGMESAKKEARAAAQAGNGAYGLWAGMGGGALRHKTGSYVDMKGWNLGLGWARENAVQAGTLTFGPFVEYGRGSYDSYLDDGTHGSGKTSFFGAGVMAKLETGSHWIDGSLRVGRTKSDYTGLATYDTTSTYYGVQVGVGKDYHVNETDTVGAYVRYAYSHTAGTSAHLSKGETYDFDAVNSHRLRIGTRYTHGGTALSQIYAGLAWEYEFDGDARATYQGDSTPSPSLKGGSALLELGYRFAPKADSLVSYDLNLTGWQGKRQGITGGLSVKWAF